MALWSQVLFTSHFQLGKCPNMTRNTQDRKCEALFHYESCKTFSSGKR